MLDGLTLFGVSVERHVSLAFGELCSGQLGPSEWCTLRWTIKYVISHLPLAASWGTPRRLHLLATKPTHCTRRSIIRGVGSFAGRIHNIAIHAIRVWTIDSVRK